MYNWYWVFVFYLLVLHLRVSACTIYIHRYLCHGSIEIKPALEHFCKFILWVTNLYFNNFKKIIRAQHLKHHQTADSKLDPHSPHHYTFKEMLDFHHNEPGRPYYVSENDIKHYSKKIKSDNTWLDNNVYIPYQYQGILFWIPVMLVCFGPLGTIIGYYLLKYLTEVHTVGLNYATHKWGYRNGQYINTPEDKSTNVMPVGILFAGEELHNNHHVQPNSAKFSRKWFEFDIGFLYCKILSVFGLVKIKYV